MAALARERDSGCILCFASPPLRRLRIATIHFSVVSSWDDLFSRSCPCHRHAGNCAPSRSRWMDLSLFGDSPRHLVVWTAVPGIWSRRHGANSTIGGWSPLQLVSQRWDFPPFAFFTWVSALLSQPGLAALLDASPQLHKDGGVSFSFFLFCFLLLLPRPRYRQHLSDSHHLATSASVRSWDSSWVRSGSSGGWKWEGRGSAMVWRVLAANCRVCTLRLRQQRQQQQLGFGWLAHAGFWPALVCLYLEETTQNKKLHFYIVAVW